MRKLFTIVLSLVAFIGISVSTANAKTLKCQTVLNTKADEVKMLKDFTDTVTTLTDGSLKFEILPAGAVVGVKETLDAVDKGLIDCGFAWTHYWSGDHPAAMLFGSPVAGGGVGIDNLAFLSWFVMLFPFLSFFAFPLFLFEFCSSNDQPSPIRWKMANCV